MLRILQYNVADYVVAPKVDNYVAPYADTDELRELVNDLMHSPIRVPVMFAAFYGMRRSEALGIRKAVIDRKKKTITVCHTVIEVSVQGEHKIIRKDRTKNKKASERTPLSRRWKHFWIGNFSSRSSSVNGWAIAIIWAIRITFVLMRPGTC